jgi:hypothetical protein
MKKTFVMKLGGTPMVIPVLSVVLGEITNISSVPIAVSLWKIARRNKNA